MADTLEDHKKQLKKKKFLWRRKRDMVLQQHIQQLEVEEDRKREEKERLEVSGRAKVSEDQEIWSARVGEVRNRLTGKRRAAESRWNERFSGTDDAGAKGL